MARCCSRKTASADKIRPGLRAAARSERISAAIFRRAGVMMSPTTNENERMNRPLDVVDPQIAELLRDEARRQATGLELIPSENLVSEAVLEAMGSIFTNKYAEGYPGRRYYGGCEYADKVEQLAIDRA